jgi:hypothetical protein
MAIDRLAARRRVTTITGWSAAGAAVLTVAFAIGAARGGHAATKTSTTPATPSTGLPPSDYQAPQPDYTAPPSQSVQPDQGFAPPTASAAPPAAMSGGS